MKGAFALVGLLGLVACGAEAGAPDPSAPPSSSPAAPAPGGGTGGSSGTTGTPPPTAPAPLGAPYPVVLLHGMAGFGKLEVGPVGLTYFEGIAEDLTKRGEMVFVTLAPPFDSSEARAKAIATQIDEILAKTGKAKVNLVGHSQGGIDARLLASPNGLGYGDRIASVTTIATPHLGTRIADTVLRLIKDLPPSMVDDLTGNFLSFLQKTAYELDTDVHLRAQLNELSEKYMTTVFNPKYQDDPRVRYASYAGRTNLRDGKGVCDGGAFLNEPTKLDPAQPMLAPMALFLEGGKGKVNDGLVTVESSKWGTFHQCVPADHLEEVGVLAPASSFDHVAFFREVVARIRTAGD